MDKAKIGKDEYFDQEVMKNARAGAQYWYEEIWQNVGKCVFCDLREKYIIHETDGIVLTTNLFPYIDGQMMIIPRRHVNSVKELSQHEWEIMRMYSYVAKKIFREVHGYKDMWFLLREGGVNAQRTVTDHLHVQLIPFDAPDLAKWNYRKLKYTPLENAQKYQKEQDYIEDKIKGFFKKYSEKTTTPVIGVDAVIMNEKNQILLGKKKEGVGQNQFEWVLPGGRVNPDEKNLEEALLREIQEETGIKADKKDLKLINAKFEDIKFQKVERTQTEKFLFCTYVLKVKSTVKIKSGDDLETLKWFDFDEAKKLKSYLVSILEKV